MVTPLRIDTSDFCLDERLARGCDGVLDVEIL